MWNINAAYPNVEHFSWDVVILDMTFQVSSAEGSEARKVALAGLELLQYMSSKQIAVPVIVATQHAVFVQPGYLSIGSIQELAELLRESFPRNYAGVVSVDLASEGWHQELVRLIRGALENE